MKWSQALERHSLEVLIWEDHLKKLFHLAIRLMHQIALAPKKIHNNISLRFLRQLMEQKMLNHTYTNDMLDFSKIKADELELESQPQAETALNLTYLRLPELRPYLKDKRVLVVDTSGSNRLMLRLQAQVWGMLLQETDSPAQALAWLRQGEPFDVVILKHDVLQVDGLGLAAKIRHLESVRTPPEVNRPASPLPLVILTSLTRREAEQEAARIGVEITAFLDQPINPTQLLEALATIFRGQPTRVRRQDSGELLFDPDTGRQLPLDPAALETLRQKVSGERALLVELIDTFLANLPPLLANLRQAVEQGHADRVRLAAHTLKLGSTSLGAKTLARLCQELEEMGRTGTLAGAAEQLSRVEAELELVKEALEELRRE